MKKEHVYHIDPVGGNDAHDGRSPERPLWTWAGRRFAPGDTVLFKRGSVVRGVLQACTGEPGAPVTYGAYGEGKAPAFLGSVAAGDPDLWVEERPFVRRFTGRLESKVCNVIFNDGETCGVMRWEPGDLQVIGDWHCTGIGTGCLKEEGKSAAGDGGVLYLFSLVNPGRAWCSIECALWGQRYVVSGNHDVVIENLSFRNAGVHGFRGDGVRGIVIRDCEFRFIGGAVWERQTRLRFGNGIEFWWGSEEVTVEGCVIDSIYDSGVTHQGGQAHHIPRRLFFRDNLFIDCGLSTYESREPAGEVWFEHNTCINAGGGFSMQGESPPRRTDPYLQPVGYHVMIWLMDHGTQPGPVHVRNNIFGGSTGAAVSAIIEPDDLRKFHFDDSAYWQEPGALLIQSSRLTGYKAWAELMAMSHGVNKWFAVTGDHRWFRAAEFARCQAELGQDPNSRVAQPLLMDPHRGDFRQRPDSPCLVLGLRRDVRRQLRPSQPAPAAN
jgi:hypothetical protein